MTENKFKIGQKVMVASSTIEEDRGRVGIIKKYSEIGNVCEVEYTNGEAMWWHESRLEPLPEMLQGYTQEEAERTVKAIYKTVDALKAMGKALKAEAERQQAEALKQIAEPFKDKRIAELEKQVEDLKRELVQRPIVVLPKEAVVNIRVGKAMEEYEAIKSRNQATDG